MMETINKKKMAQENYKMRRVLSVLSACVDYDTLVYILRALYHIIFKASRLNESSYQLQRRIQRFERESLLPEFLSVLPIERLLTELEDAQYYYPIRRQEVTLPRFH